MNGLRAACLLLVVFAAGTPPSLAAEARKQWRPATAEDIARQQALTGAGASVPARTTDFSAPGPLAQQAYIDPRTNELISQPPAASSALPATAATPGPDFALQRTPEGFLYIDTSEYRHIETVVIETPGALNTECSMQSPWAEPAASVSTATVPTDQNVNSSEPHP